jgi:hypothetical protein
MGRVEVGVRGEGIDPKNVGTSRCYNHQGGCIYFLTLFCEFSISFKILK